MDIVDTRSDGSFFVSSYSMLMHQTEIKAEVYYTLPKNEGFSFWFVRLFVHLCLLNTS